MCQGIDGADGVRQPLTISLFMLIPGMPAMTGRPPVRGDRFGLLFVVGSLVSLLRVRRTQPGELRDAGFLVGVAVVFALQPWFGLRLVADDDADVGAMRGVCVLVLVCFLVGIARAWELVGGPSIGLRSELSATLRDRERRGD